MTEREVYKGIEYVRVSKLPREQSVRINASFPKEKIFKILRDDEVIISDCIQYRDYQDWFKKSFQPSMNSVGIKPDNVRNNTVVNMNTK
jgi:cytochrome c peroxidase